MLVGLADPRSLRKCLDDCEAQGWPDADPKQGDPLYRDGDSLTRFVNAKYPRDGFTDNNELDAAIVQRMHETGCDYPTALREVTREPKMAALWQEHQRTHTAILTE